MPAELPEDLKREIFSVLITAQDWEMTVAESRHMVMEMYGLTEAQLEEIEREGMAGGWPPL